MDLSFDIGRSEIDFVTLIVAKFESCRLDLETLGPFYEATPIGAAAEFAIGNYLQADLLLQIDHVADVLVLQPTERAVIDFAGSVPAKCLAQGLRPQEAADMVGTNWRAAGGEHERGLWIFSISL